jgi:membrane-associated phospholipid phosphatase
MQRSVKMPLLGALGCIAGLAVLVYAAYSVGPVERLDLRIFLHFTGEDSRAMGPASLLIHLGDLGPLLIFMAMVVALGMYFGRRREIVAALAVIVGANLTTQLLKVVLENPRHATQNGMTHAVWSSLPSADAFPSGHTTAAASVAVALLFVVPARHRMSALAAGILLTAALAISVVVLTWHYPSDALGAILVAALWGFLMVTGLRLRMPRRRDKKATSPTVHGPLATSRR